VILVSLYLLLGCLGFHYMDGALKPHRRPLFKTVISFQLIVCLVSTKRTGCVGISGGRFLRLELVMLGRSMSTRFRVALDTREYGGQKRPTAGCIVFYTPGAMEIVRTLARIIIGI
jgi:hypothetical protein